VTGGRELVRTSIGKPYGETYRFAERVLGGYREGVLRGLGMGQGEEGMMHGPLRRVYMVGDNPESDIAGANGFVSGQGTEWVSVLVRTGVWSEGRGGKLEGEFEPRGVVDDVVGAVKWALRREGWAQGEEGEGLK
jgi:ribonucleotide monophosphatase NagD (HAD superfamily)